MTQKKSYWLCALISAAAITCAFWIGAEPHFRWAGGALQLLGIVAVFVGIEKTRADFGHSTILKRGHDWLQNWLGRWRRRNTYEYTGSGGLFLGGGSVSG